MELLTVILGIIVLGGIVAVFVVLTGRLRGVSDQLKRIQEAAGKNEGMMLLNQNLQGMHTRLDETAKTLQSTMQAQFGQSAKIIQDVTERLTKLDETNRQVVGFSEQLRKLQDILQNPKQRGILGEYYLETVMKNVLPPGSFQMQYKFSDGEIVDAVIFASEKIIPVDSKFSLENYNRIVETTDDQRRTELEKAFKNDLKFRIDETAKYVRPTENTMDFAFMFIPSEAIYYDLLINQIGAVKVNTQNLIEYAFREKHVLIVSPTTFLAYLQTVLQGLKALQIEQSAKVIRQNVELLTRHLKSYEEQFRKVGAHLGTTVGAYNASYQELVKIDKDVVKITGIGIGVEKPMLEKPAMDE